MTLAPLIIAHRGDSTNAPENTMAAFRQAIAAGADGVEFDVRLSNDGVPVVIHDGDTRRTTGIARPVSAATAKELGELDAGSWFNRTRRYAANDAFIGTGVPSLGDVLELYANETGPIYVELKIDDVNVQPMADAVSNVLLQFPGLIDRVIVKSFRLAAIPAIRHLLPGVQTGALFEPSIANIIRGRKHLITLAAEFGADQLSLHYSLASRSIVQRAAESGMPVTIWTVDDPKWVSRCRQRGIGALITNDPGRLVAIRGG
jgi:glycerophosphoryl diester phosphodiesterase